MTGQPGKGGREVTEQPGKGGREVTEQPGKGGRDMTGQSCKFRQVMTARRGDLGSPDSVRVHGQRTSVLLEADHAFGYGE